MDFDAAKIQAIEYAKNISQSPRKELEITSINMKYLSQFSKK